MLLEIKMIEEALLFLGVKVFLVNWYYLLKTVH